MTVPASIEQEVAQRAGQRCEYCRMHQSLQGATFHVEHIIPRSRNGSSQLDKTKRTVRKWISPPSDCRPMEPGSTVRPRAGFTFSPLMTRLSLSPLRVMTYLFHSPAGFSRRP